MQQRIEQHRSVTIRQNETVAVGPYRVIRIEPQKTLPQRVRDGRESHRRAGMPRVRLLHRVHGKRADGIDTKLIDSRLRGRHLRVSIHLSGIASILVRWEGASSSSVARN